MIIKRNLLLSLLFLFVLTNCQNKNIPTEQSKQCEPIVLKSHKSITLDEEYANLVNVIKLETNDSSLLSTITRIYMDENLFFIFDSYVSKLIIFNNEGKYINQIGKKGEGPKEYGALLDFCVNPHEKQIYLLCDHPNKMMVFDYQGNFIREKYFNILYCNIVADNKYIYVENPYHREIKQSQIIVLDTEGEVVSYLLPILGENISLFPGHNFFTQNPHTYYTRRFDNSIYELKDGQIEKKYTFDFKEKNLPSTFLKDLPTNPQEKDVDLLRERTYIYALLVIAEGDRYLLFNTNIDTYIFDKKEKSLQYTSLVSNPYLSIYSMNSMTIGNSNGMFATCPSSYTVEKTKESISTNKANNLSQEQKDLIMSIKEDDNPVLFIYQLK